MQYQDEVHGSLFLQASRVVELIYLKYLKAPITYDNMTRVETYPCIANAFFRAGYVESWGRGIQKICESCKAYGTEPPEYMVHSEDIMVKLTALPNVQTIDSKDLDVTKDVTKESLILNLIKANASITTAEMSEQLSVDKRTIQRYLSSLKKKGIIERKGGKRFGFWEIKK